MKEEFKKRLRQELSFSGFSQDGIDGIATILIGDKEEVTEDELTRLISVGKSFATIGQKEVDRRVATAKPKEQSKSEPVEDNKTEPRADDALLEAIRALQGQVSELKGENVRKTRKERAMSVYEGLDEDTKAKRIEFVSNLNFKSEDDFDSYLESEKGFVSSAIKKQGNDSVNSVGGIGGRSKSTEDKLTDEELKAAFPNLK